MTNRRMIQVITLPAESVVMSAADYDYLAASEFTIKHLGQELGLAEEGLANYAQELEGARHDIERLMAATTAEANEVARLRLELADLRRAYEHHKGDAERLRAALRAERCPNPNCPMPPQPEKP